MLREALGFARAIVLRMARKLTVQLGLWLARCLVLAFAWALAQAPAALSLAGDGCGADCPCDVVPVGEVDPCVDDAAGANADDHAERCPEDCALCGCGPLVAGLTQGHQALTVLLHGRDVASASPVDSWLPGVGEGVFRPPRRSS